MWTCSGSSRLSNFYTMKYRHMGAALSVRVSLLFLGFSLQAAEELRGVEQSGSSSGS
jgi:hypothetical protein